MSQRKKAPDRGFLFQCNLLEQIISLELREGQAWEAAKLFMTNRDAHGLHDIGVEIEGLRRARTELEKLTDGR